MINSDFKFYQGTEDYFLLGEHLDLSNKLQIFFSQQENDELWRINTHRQDTTKALRNTESIMLRQISIAKVMSKMKDNFVNTTNQCNQIMDLEDSELLNRYVIFQEAISQLDSIFKMAGAKDIEYGRIFFSKFKAGTSIDQHTDSGRYFSYYDRFHFVIETPAECIFHINKDIHLQKGGFYLVNNHIPHWLKNNGAIDRINLIIDARLK